MAGVSPDAVKPAVRIYTKRWCGYCFAARRLLSGLGIAFEEIALDRDPALRREVSARAGHWPTVPMIFVGERFIGGYSEAAELHRRGELEALCRGD